ncbi:MAG: hypothetical protein OHK93_008811 [Ramalina farinacea]|uniref:Uncharacterized protein n=1 Tax=Ramalina farinacea TaxID=258253 RepID=A0AA43QSE3_9LECA|nr:hypothetical protein [Ramalina farinacea]
MSPREREIVLLLDPFGVSETIQQCDFQKIRNRLHSDLRNIPVVFGPNDQTKMEKMLKKVRDRVFREVKMEDSALDDYAIDLNGQQEKAKSSKGINIQAARDAKGKADTKSPTSSRSVRDKLLRSESAQVLRWLSSGTALQLHTTSRYPMRVSYRDGEPFNLLDTKINL